jgi:hypothetical protein
MILAAKLMDAMATTKAWFGQQSYGLQKRPRERVEHTTAFSAAGRTSRMRLGTRSKATLGEVLNHIPPLALTARPPTGSKNQRLQEAAGLQPPHPFSDRGGMRTSEEDSQPEGGPSGEGGSTVGMPSSTGTGARAVTPSGGPNGGWRASVGRRSGGATQMAL